MNTVFYILLAIKNILMQCMDSTMMLTNRMFKAIGKFFSFLFGWIKMPQRRYPKTIEKLIEVMVPLFDLNFEQDEIVLGAGQHEVVVETERPVKRVWFTFAGVRGIPICQGSPDMVGITVIPEGFVINADIKSDRRGIRYFAILKRDADEADEDLRSNPDDDDNDRDR